MRRAAIFTILFMTASTLAADDNVLLPLLLASNCPRPPLAAVLEPWHGPNGTEWKTDLWIRNGSGSAVPIETCPSLCDVYLMPPGEIRQIGSNGFCAPEYAARGPLVVPGFFDYSLWIVETTHGQRVSMPVVRPAARHRGPFYLLGIHVNPNVRHTLRLYELSGSERTDVTVRLLTISGTELSSKKVSLTAPPHTRSTYYVPGFAQFGSFGDLFPDVANWPAIVHLEIVPENADRQLWAMVTITNNDTQEVSVVAPDQGLAPPE